MKGGVLESCCFSGDLLNERCVLDLPFLVGLVFERRVCFKMVFSWEIFERGVCLRKLLFYVLVVLIEGRVSGSCVLLGELSNEACGSKACFVLSLFSGVFERRAYSRRVPFFVDF